MSKKFWPDLRNDLLYRKGQDFLNRQYVFPLSSIRGLNLNFPWFYSDDKNLAKFAL